MGVNGGTETRITINDSLEAVELFGKQDENLRFLQKNCSARITTRGGAIIITGGSEAVEEAASVLQHLLALVRAGNEIGITEVNYALGLVRAGQSENAAGTLGEVVLTTSRGKPIKPKTLGQQRYIQAIRQNDIVFAIGPAGTGKTYLAVVMAVEALRKKMVGRIILVRPAVEAGEKLGFLPGDLQDKVDPYLRPLYDGLYDILGLEIAQRHMQKGIIEVAPLAYMRGRTLNDAFIILDEAQNTTPEQMKMFLTRLGFGSKAVITGDITQVDLPRGNYSGLIEVQTILQGVDGIFFQYLTAQDTVRHQLVQKIIHAYEDWEETKENETRS
ncbi:MAG: PhoH family protein [Syntrophomonadaceae bacterium]|nr:PhoH family protein [Syntrophomonadaceae bacterium]